MIHGVDYSESQVGPMQIIETPSGVIALTGIAPKGPFQQLTRVRNLQQASVFGDQVPGFSIPQALATLFGEGASDVIVVNVYDIATDITAVATESLTLVGGKGKFAFPPISGIVVKNQAGAITYVKDVDYKVDSFGNIESLNYTTIAPTAQLQLTYNKQDAAATVASDIIGSVTGSVRTGMKLFENSYANFKVEPRIFIAPQFAQLAGVRPELAYWADRMLGVYIMDPPPATSVANVIAGRGPSGTIGFNTSDERAIMAYPWIKSFDPATNTDIAKPPSQFIAGVMARVDAAPGMGFWFSPSNNEIRTASALEIVLTGDPIKPAGTDVQSLNDVGIVTVINSDGFKVWGNRTAAFPSTSGLMTFIPARRTVDILITSILRSSVPFIGKPMTIARRDSIQETGNDFVRSYVGKGAFVDGRAFYDPAKNPIGEIANGHWTFSVTGAPTPTLEHLTWDVIVDTSLLSRLNENLA